MTNIVAISSFLVGGVLLGCAGPTPPPPSDPAPAPPPPAAASASPVASATAASSAPPSAGSQSLAGLIARYKADKKGLVGSAVKAKGFIFDIGTFTNGAEKVFTVSMSTGKKADKGALYATCYAKTLPPGLGEGLGGDLEIIASGTFVEINSQPAIQDCVVTK